MTYPIGTAAKLIEVASQEVGTIEEGDNLTKYGKFTKADGLPCRGLTKYKCAVALLAASKGSVSAWSFFKADARPSG